MGRLFDASSVSQPRRDVVTFDDINRGFDYAVAEKGMALGPLVVERRTGWPMGGSHSEPATLVDAGAFVHKLHHDPAVLRETGLAVGGLPAESVIAGLMHVDDLLCGSRIHCADCLGRGLSRLFPPDLRFDEEERGASVRFLHTTITATSRGIEVGLHNPNELFARGLCPLPRISRCPVFVSVQVTPLATLRAFLLPHLFAVAQICGRRPSAPALGPVALLLLEAARSGWGPRALALVLHSLPPRYDIPVFAAIRSIARPLRLQATTDVLQRTLCLYDRWRRRRTSDASTSA